MDPDIPTETLLSGPDFDALLAEIEAEPLDEAYWEGLLADGWDR